MEEKLSLGTAVISTFLVVICLLIDMLAFFFGLLLFKNIYLFGKNSGILQMGYLNYEIALSYLFTHPKDSHCRVLHLAFMYRVLYGDASALAKLEDNKISDFETGGREADMDIPELEGNVPEACSESDNPVNTPPDPSTGSADSSDTESPASPDQAAPNEQNADKHDTAGPNEAASETNSQTVPAENDEPEALVPDFESAAHAGDTADENIPSQQAKKDSQSEQIETYLQDMDYLHRIMRSEDYKKLEATMRALGIMEFDVPEAEQDDSYASLQLWLRNFIEENGITFDELFPPKEDG